MLVLCIHKTEGCVSGHTIISIINITNLFYCDSIYKRWECFLYPLYIRIALIYKFFFKLDSNFLIKSYNQIIIENIVKWFFDIEKKNCVELSEIKYVDYKYVSKIIFMSHFNVWQEHTLGLNHTFKKLLQVVIKSFQPTITILYSLFLYYSSKCIQYNVNVLHAIQQFDNLSTLCWGHWKIIIENKEKCYDIFLHIR